MKNPYTHFCVHTLPTHMMYMMYMHPMTPLSDLNLTFLLRFIKLKTRIEFADADNLKMACFSAD